MIVPIRDGNEEVRKVKKLLERWEVLIVPIRDGNREGRLGRGIENFEF